MNHNKYIKNTINILLPFVLGGGILYWMYREYDFAQLKEIVEKDMNWGWMMFSMVFGVTAQMFRGLRWKQSLEPLDEHPSLMNCMHGVFISYASSLVIPRSGEFTRCGVLSKYDGVSFSKALGTVVAERMVDSLLLLVIMLLVFLFQLRILNVFFDTTGTNIVGMLQGFTATGYIVTAICILVTLAFLWYVIRRFAFMSRIRQAIGNVTMGIMSLSGVRHKWLYAFYSIMIWVSYILHHWIAFYSFDFTAEMGFTPAIVSFIVGSIAVIVPTPNGAGPWHFAVKTILILYGLSGTNAESFVLIVHTLQSALIPLLGIFSLFCLSFKGTKN